MVERLVQLRKALNLSQAKFAKQIGLTQGTLGAIEIGKSNLTERNFDSICRVFNVNPEWLRHGVGEMFNPPVEKSFLDQLAEEKGLDARHKALIKSIIELPADIREGVIDWALNLAHEINSRTSEQQIDDELQQLMEQKEKIENRIEELTNRKKFFSDNRIDEELSRSEKHKLLDEELDAAEKKKILSVSTGLNGLAKQNSS